MLFSFCDADPQPWQCKNPQPDGSCVHSQPTQAQWEWAKSAIPQVGRPRATARQLNRSQPGCTARGTLGEIARATQQRLGTFKKPNDEASLSAPVRPQGAPCKDCPNIVFSLTDDQDVMLGGASHAPAPPRGRPARGQGLHSQ